MHSITKWTACSLAAVALGATWTVSVMARGGKAQVTPYQVVSEPEPQSAQRWGAIQGTCRLSHAVVSFPVVVGCSGDQSTTRPSRTALSDPKHLTLSNCLVHIEDISSGKSWPASMRGSKREHLIRLIDDDHLPRMSWARHKTQLVFQAPGAKAENQVHGYFRDLADTRFNFFIAVGSPPIRSGAAVLADAGMYLLRGDCRVALNGHVFSSSHPYVSEPTTTSGHYSLSHVPPGSYRLRLIHEGLGGEAIIRGERVAGYRRDALIVMHRDVTVKPGEALTVNWLIEVPASLRASDDAK